jgi:hypothetical protein
MSPSYNSLVEALETCVQDGKRNSDSILAGDYVVRRLAKSRYTVARKTIGLSFPKTGSLFNIYLP